ncbi:MAG: DUF3299 domain-containing protein [Planctomycetota bacterium]|jgi:hypothetical protein
MQGGAATPASDASKILPQFFFAAAAIVIGAGVVWWNSRGGEAPAPAPPASPGASAAPAPAPTPVATEPTAVSFDLLDDWRYPDGGYAIETAGLEREGYRSTEPPDAIKALDGVRIRIDGFVLPVELDRDGRITSAMLLRHQLGCGYGTAPTPSQRIAVTIAPDAELNWRTSQAASAVGVLRVNAKPEGAFPALYSMTVESLVFTTGYNPDAGLAPGAGK